MGSKSLIFLLVLGILMTVIGVFGSMNVGECETIYIDGLPLGNCEYDADDLVESGYYTRFTIWIVGGLLTIAFAVLLNALSVIHASQLRQIALLEDVVKFEEYIAKQHHNANKQNQTSRLNRPSQE